MREKRGSESKNRAKHREDKEKRVKMLRHKGTELERMERHIAYDEGKEDGEGRAGKRRGEGRGWRKIGDEEGSKRRERRERRRGNSRRKEEGDR